MAVINRRGCLAGIINDGGDHRADEPGLTRMKRLMADQPTHEENILYLMIELDQALARETPNWSPEQMAVATRWLTSLLARLLTIIPQS